MAGRQGWVKFTEFEHDGKKYPTRIDTSDGQFEILVPGVDGQNKRFLGTDIRKLRQEVVTFLKRNVKLEWQPVICFGWDTPWSEGRNGMTFGLHYGRFFRAKSSDGKSGPVYVWRYPAEDNWAQTEISPGKEVDTTSSSKNEPTTTYGSNVVDYTPERWKALRKISDDVAFFNNGVKGIIVKRDPEKFFEWLGDGSIQKIVVTLDSWGRKDREY